MLHIQGQRVILRDWRLDDLEPYSAWMQPGRRWQEFDGAGGGISANPSCSPPAPPAWRSATARSSTAWS